MKLTGGKERTKRSSGDFSILQSSAINGGLSHVSKFQNTKRETQLGSQMRASVGQPKSEAESCSRAICTEAHCSESGKLGNHLEKCVVLLI